MARETNVTISFGLVSIAAKMSSAVESGADISFNLLHGQCAGRLKQQYHCPQCEEVVARDDMVKGYEFEKGEYVVFTEDEIKAMQEAPTKTIDIVEFVPFSSVSLLYLDKAYFLNADKSGAKAYALLVEAMRVKDRCAVGRYVSYGKQHVVLLKATDRGLVMRHLHFRNEIREQARMEQVPIKEHELSLAMQLIDSISTAAYDGTKYVDEVKARVRGAIESKIAGAPVKVEAPKPKLTVLDLEEALAASLKAA